MTPAEIVGAPAPNHELAAAIQLIMRDCYQKVFQNELAAAARRLEEAEGLSRLLFPVPPGPGHPSPIPDRLRAIDVAVDELKNEILGIIEELAAPEGIPY